MPDAREPSSGEGLAKDTQSNRAQRFFLGQISLRRSSQWNHPGFGCCTLKGALEKNQAER
jgi:hypothetical protein